MCEFTTYSAVMCEQWTTGQMKRWKILCVFIHIWICLSKAVCNMKPNRRDKNKNNAEKKAAEQKRNCDTQALSTHKLINL